MAARRAAAMYRPEDMARDYATLVRELLGHQG
jgi:hypothetical protein